MDVRSLLSFPRRLPRSLARAPAWAKLMIAALCVGAAGAAVIILAGASALQGYLMRQADLQLQAASERLANHAVVSGLDPQAALGGLGSDGLRLEVLGPAGQWLMQPPPGGPDTGPAVPASPAWIRAHAGHLTTLPGRAGGQSWRVIAEPIRYKAHRILYSYSADGYSLALSSGDGPGPRATLVVGIGLGGIGRTVGKLELAGLAVSIVLILAAAGLGAVMVRAGLRRPLTTALSQAGAALQQTSGALEVQAASEVAARDAAERLRRILTDALHGLREPLSVISGSADYYRQRGRLGAGDPDRMMGRVADEAARMDAAVDALGTAATAPDARVPEPDEEGR